MTAAVARTLGLFPALLVVLQVPVPAHAQAWIRDPGHAYLELSTRVMTGDKVYTSGADREPLSSRYTQVALAFYGEVGIVERWLMATFGAELLRYNDLRQQGATLGLGDLRVGLWSGLVTTPLRVSLGLLAGIPTGDPSPRAGGGADADALRIARALPTGDGEWDFEPRVIVGHGFGGGESGWPLVHYVVGELGYWVRTRGMHDALTWRAELGTRVPVTVLDRIWLIARLRGTESFAGDGAGATTGDATGLGDGASDTTLSAEVRVRLWRDLDVAASVDLGLRARNVVAAVPLKFAVSYAW